MKAEITQVARVVRSAIRQRTLEHGESGWGAPTPPPLVLSTSDRPRRVVIVGAGVQGGIVARAVRELSGAEVGSVVDLDRSRSEQVAASIGLDPTICSTNAADALSDRPVDLAIIATTAPSHVELGRIALRSGVPTILIEKPIDVAYRDASEFVAECTRSGVRLGINYSRRWLVDHRAVLAAVQAGQIGAVRIITAQIGAGELAMQGSHYVDLCRMMFGSEPVDVAAQLRRREQPNARGLEFEDPTGHLTVRFASGARAYIDFEDDLAPRDAVVTIRGDDGMVVIEEGQQQWSLRSRSGRTWTFPFAEPFRPVPVATRAIFGMLEEPVPACGGRDGLAALEVILAAHHSSANEGAVVNLPLSEAQRSLVGRFP